MKRLTLLTILLVVVGLTAGFGLELKPSFDAHRLREPWSGASIWTDWSTGFQNTAEADLTVNLFAEDTEDTHKGEGDWYGSITISDIELWFDADEALAAACVTGWMRSASRRRSSAWAAIWSSASSMRPTSA